MFFSNQRSLALRFKKIESFKIYYHFLASTPSTEQNRFEQIRENCSKRYFR